MEAGLTDHVWEIEDLIELFEAEGVKRNDHQKWWPLDPTFITLEV